LIRTLIIEDDLEKRGHIERVLATVPGFSTDRLLCVASLNAAQRVLTNGQFDLLVLDIALPLREDGHVDPEAGLDLLEDIFRNPDALRTPTHIVGITAHEDIFEKALSRFSGRLLTLVRYDATEGEWEAQVKARVAHIIAAIDAAEKPGPCESLAAVLCALPSPELSSVLSLPMNWTQTQVLGDHSIYWEAAVKGHHGEQRIVAASAAHMGMPSAAVLAMKMIHAFKPQFIAMAGIAAGVRGRVEMGDLIIPDPCWDWGGGKWVLEGSQHRFLPAARQMPLSGQLRERCRVLARDAALFERIYSDWSGDKPDRPPRLHVAPLASGGSVLADGVSIQRIIEQHKDLVGVEMEAYSVFAAGEEAGEPRPIPLVVKAVVDFADGSKGDAYQEFGAYASSALLMHILLTMD
jgi:nucleoside phosphorylase/CheY-like chemotaxis protein